MIEIRDGEGIAGDDELGVTLLGDIEQLGVVEVSSVPGGIAPPLHVHERHAEAFFVFEGELTFRLENGEHKAERESWAFIPPEVVHTFAVTGDERARFLDFHVPSIGFGDFVRGLHAARGEDELRAVRAAFDQRPAPEYAAGDPGLAVFRRTGGMEGETIVDRPGRRLTLLIEADELTVTEFVHGPGERGAERHVHHHHADGFLVVEGELTLSTRDGSFAAPAGTFLVVPPDVVHGFDNEGTTTVRCFNFHAPSMGFGDHLRQRSPDFDQHDPPADGGVDPESVMAVRLTKVAV